MPAPKGNRYAAKYDNGEMEKICEQLLHWAENARSIHFANFSRKVLKKSTKWLRETAEHYPELAEAIEEAKQLLSAKIVDSCVYNDDEKFRYQPAMDYLPVYDMDYKAMLKWKEDIKHKKEEKYEFKPAWAENSEFMKFEALKHMHPDVFEEFKKMIEEKEKCKK